LIASLLKKKEASKINDLKPLLDWKRFADFNDFSGSTTHVGRLPQEEVMSKEDGLKGKTEG
jgi:hypothetical protein